jgi:hypothetical protein
MHVLLALLPDLFSTIHIVLTLALTCFWTVHNNEHSKACRETIASKCNLSSPRSRRRGGSSRCRCRHRAPRPRCRSSPRRKPVWNRWGWGEESRTVAIEGRVRKGWGANWAAPAVVLGGGGLGWRRLRSWAVEVVELDGRAPQRRMSERRTMRMGERHATDVTP